jgi:hypothetical protein
VRRQDRKKRRKTMKKSGIRGHEIFFFGIHPVILEVKVQAKGLTSKLANQDTFTGRKCKLGCRFG